MPLPPKNTNARDTLCEAKGNLAIANIMIMRTAKKKAVSNLIDEVSEQISVAMDLMDVQENFGVECAKMSALGQSLLGLKA